MLDLMYLKDFGITEINQKDIVIDVEIRGRERKLKNVAK